MIGRRILLVGLPLAACSAPPPPEVMLTIKAGSDQNPSPSGQATPVQVRLLQLADTGKFGAADPLAIARAPSAALGDSLLGMQDVIVSPGQTLALKIAPKPGAGFLGVAVLFRNIDQAHWRAVAPVAPHGPTPLVLTITHLSASL